MRFDNSLWFRGAKCWRACFATVWFLTALTGVSLAGAGQPWASEPGGKEESMSLPAGVMTGTKEDFNGMLERRVVRVLVVYSKTSYFGDMGTPRGITYEAFRLFEEHINKKYKTRKLPVHVVFIPVGRDDIIPALQEGRGDIAAALLTITPERIKAVDFSNPTFKGVSEIIVTGPSSPPLAGKDDLSGKEVFVRKSSSYHESLLALNRELANRGKPAVRIKLAPEELQDEDLLEMVNAGLVGMIVCDDVTAELWKKVLPEIVLHPEVAIRTGGEFGWMIRKESPLLKAELNDFIAKYPQGSSTYNTLLQRYFKNTKFVKNAGSEAEMRKFRETAEFFKKYSDQYEMDYLLMAAQGYQESRLDQKVKSPVGAIGVMQVMPATGKELEVGDIMKVENNIHAGVKYMRFMVDRYYAGEPMDRLNKALFAFASYSAGPARISKLRKATAERGLNPNLWFNNVEVLASEKIGRETVNYVANIYKYYIAYKLVTEARQAANEAKDQLRMEGDRKE